jgi:RNA exonuclease NGL2
MFRQTGKRVIFYDEAFVRGEGDEAFRKGLSFRTKNIALMITLERLDRPRTRYVVATTHLFWHPR